MDDQLDDEDEYCDDGDDGQGGGQHLVGAVRRSRLPDDSPVLQSSAGGLYLGGADVGLIIRCWADHQMLGILRKMTMITITCYSKGPNGSTLRGSH